MAQTAIRNFLDGLRGAAEGSSPRSTSPLKSFANTSVTRARTNPEVSCFMAKDKTCAPKVTAWRVIYSVDIVPVKQPNREQP